MIEQTELTPVSTVGREELISRIIGKLMAHEDMLSYSSLSNFWDSPKDFIDYKLKQKETTPAMLFGQILHCLVLQPDEFEKRYHMIDDADIVAQIGGGNPRNTKAYKEWKVTALAEAGDRMLITDKDARDAKIMANNILFNRASRKILNANPEREKPVEWEYQNFLFRGFIDGNGPKGIFDLKMVPDASKRKAQATIVNEGYYLQAAMYLTALGVKKPYHIICVDKKGGVSVHLISDHLMQEGFDQYARLIKQFNLAILEERFNESHDFWADRHDGIFECDKPAYLY